MGDVYTYGVNNWVIGSKMAKLWLKVAKLWLKMAKLWRIFGSIL